MTPVPFEFSIQTFATAEDAYDNLYAFVEQFQEPIGEVKMIQYRGKFSRGLIKTLIKYGAKVSVFLQHPGTALAIGASKESEKLHNTLRELYDEMVEQDWYADNKQNLVIYRYIGLASLSGVQLGRKALLLSSENPSFGHALSTGEDRGYEASGRSYSQAPHLSRTKVPGRTFPTCLSRSPQG